MTLNTGEKFTGPVHLTEASRNPKTTPNKTHGDGKKRVCAKEDCDTKLSEYNEYLVCGVHDAEFHTFRIRGGHPSEWEQ